MGLVEWSAVLGNAGEFFGAIAVFATLFYLARQIRHSSAAQDRANQLAQSESVTSSNALFIETWAQLASDRELAEIYQKAFSDQALDEIDTVRYVAFANVYLSWLEVLYTQARVELGFSEVEGREGLVRDYRPLCREAAWQRSGTRLVGWRRSQQLLTRLLRRRVQGDRFGSQSASYRTRPVATLARLSRVVWQQVTRGSLPEMSRTAERIQGSAVLVVARGSIDG